MNNAKMTELRTTKPALRPPENPYLLVLVMALNNDHLKRYMKKNIYFYMLRIKINFKEYLV
jgi:LEA14-like dessication related protein